LKSCPPGYQYWQMFHPLSTSATSDTVHRAFSGLARASRKVDVLITPSPLWTLLSLILWFHFFKKRNTGFSASVLPAEPLSGLFLGFGRLFLFQRTFVHLFQLFHSPLWSSPNLHWQD
jgi:hypothetical protein